MVKTINVTSQWAREHLKSPASRLFTQAFIQTQIKENIKAPRHWPLRGEFPRKWPVTWKMCPFDDVIMSAMDSHHIADKNVKHVTFSTVHLSVALSFLHIFRKHMAMTSHDRHGVSNHRQLHCLFNRLFRRSSKKTRYRPLWGVRVRKLYLKSDKVKQCNISSHLKWVLVADKSMHIIKVQ